MHSWLIKDCNLFILSLISPLFRCIFRLTHDKDNFLADFLSIASSWEMELQFEWNDECNVFYQKQQGKMCIFIIFHSEIKTLLSKDYVF